MPEPSDDSSSAEDFDLAAFEARVQEELKTLQALVAVKAGLAGPSPEAEAQLNKSLGQLFAPIAKDLSAMFSASVLRNMKTAKKIDEHTTAAREFLKQPNTRLLLCPTLQTVESNLSKLKHRSIELDSSEVASAITPILSSGLHASEITIARHPLIYALCAWMIARTGVTKYCAEAKPFVG
jgi:hypothetical protein